MFFNFCKFSNIHMNVTLQLRRLWYNWKNTLVNKFLQFSALVPQTFQSSYWYSTGFSITSKYTIMSTWVNSNYHINCGVMQGFPALGKAVTTHVKKYHIFSRVDIAN